jgi:hypothetical protein
MSAQPLIALSPAPAESQIVTDQEQAGALLGWAERGVRWRRPRVSRR